MIDMASSLMAADWMRIFAKWEETENAIREAMERHEPEPDYSCGGVDTSEPTFEQWLWDMGWTVETRHKIGYSITREPDLMAAMRDIARGS